MIDLRRFSLNKTQIQIQRYSSTLVDGIVQKTLDETLQAWASVQPYDTVDPSSRFEPEVGRWVEEKYIMYIDQVIYQDNSSDLHPDADIIVADGVEYEPIRVQKWLHLNNEHYKVLLQRYDGD
ncbi:MAG: hypothetical protein E2O82_03735 [Betaproteobacteria bacterium]|nr:MAG: hypothetical protein E2O82_03735 [Betaproteobacteria bacterium]